MGKTIKSSRPGSLVKVSGTVLVLLAEQARIGNEQGRFDLGAYPLLRPRPLTTGAT